MYYTLSKKKAHWKNGQSSYSIKGKKYLCPLIIQKTLWSTYFASVAIGNLK